MMIELIFNNVQRFHPAHMPYIILYGLFYVVFAWTFAYFNGFYFYFFINPRFPRVILSHIALLTALSVFFFLGYFVTSYLNPREHVYAPPILLLGTLLICKWRRPAPLDSNKDK